MRKGYLEVKTKIDSQSLIQKIMTKMSNIEPIDFVFAIGNEERYKDVFSYIVKLNWIKLNFYLWFAKIIN